MERAKNALPVPPLHYVSLQPFAIYGLRLMNMGRKEEGYKLHQSTINRRSCKFEKNLQSLSKKYIKGGLLKL